MEKEKTKKKQLEPIEGMYYLEDDDMVTVSDVSFFYKPASCGFDLEFSGWPSDSTFSFFHTENQKWYECEFDLRGGPKTNPNFRKLYAYRRLRCQGK